MKVVIFLFLGAAIHSASDSQVSCINIKENQKLFLRTQISSSTKFDLEDDDQSKVKVDELDSLMSKYDE